MTHRLAWPLALLLALPALAQEKMVTVDREGRLIKEAMGAHGDLYRACRCTTPQGGTKFCECTAPATTVTKTARQAASAQMCTRELVPVSRTPPAPSQLRMPVLVER